MLRDTFTTSKYKRTKPLHAHILHDNTVQCVLCVTNRDDGENGFEKVEKVI